MLIGGTKLGDWWYRESLLLIQLFTPNTLSELPESIRADMAEFCETVLIEGVPLKQMRIPLTLDEGVELLRRVYGL